MKPLTYRFLAVSLLAAVAGTSSLWAEDAVRVSEAEFKKAAVTKVVPDYPPLAKQLRVAGRAEVDVYVAEDGSVEKAEPLSGNPLFTSAATNALKKWKFTPFKADGKAVKAVGKVAFDFHQ